MAYNVRAAGIAIVTINGAAIIRVICRIIATGKMVGNDKRSSLFFRGTNYNEIGTPKYGL